MNPRHWIKLVYLTLMMLAAAPIFGQTRVACVGDSITFGATIVDREHNAYPAQLQAMLGEDYDVRNFGVNGATLLSAGNKPYIQQQAYRDALAFAPDIVVIMLGTNDTKQVNWQHRHAFVEDYRALIASFGELDSKPRVIVALPVPAWTEGDSIDGERVLDEVIPNVRSVAHATGVRLIDLHTPMRDQAGRFPDKVHPDGLGAGLLAKMVYEQVVLKTDAEYDLRPALPDDAAAFGFHGYRGLDFKLDGVACKVVQPMVAAEGRPWVWRARFWGHQPQADLAMLERGWHIVYCDVANLFGNAQAVKRWDGFYAAMREAGLGEDLVLEGLSRGGLIIYNWAKQNPDKVKAIYGDAPVCDIRSWPGGKGAGKGSAGDWQRALQAHGITDADAAEFTGNPIDGLEPLAKAGVPLLHIVGDADDVVPVAENTAILEQRYRELGGTITVIHKPGIGHHPHALPDPKPIVDFYLRATGRAINFAAIAQPSPEYRAGAGWGGDTWRQQHAKINQLGKDHPAIDLVFLGDSISQGWTGAEQRLAQPDGSRPFDRQFARYHAASFGLSGDRTENLLWRIEQGNFEHIKPRAIVLMIGVNNIHVVGHRGEDVAEGTRLILDALAQHAPQAQVLMLGCFPTGPTADSPTRREVDALHAALAPLADGQRVHYRDLRPHFLNDDGTPNANLSGDHIHLTPAGYRAWAEAIAPDLAKILAER